MEQKKTAVEKKKKVEIDSLKKGGVGKNGKKNLFFPLDREGPFAPCRTILLDLDVETGARNMRWVTTIQGFNIFCQIIVGH